MTDWPKQSECNEFYGDPRGPNGRPSPAWEKQNLMPVIPPWKLVTAWDGRQVKGVRVHIRCAKSLDRVFREIWRASSGNPDVIAIWGMDRFGGAYNFRVMRGSSALSMHAWGCAVDFDPARNAFGSKKPNFARCPSVLSAFAAEGWTWGGEWKKPDAMHFQAARVK